MTRFFRTEAGAVVLWVASSLLLAALISPWIYQIGKGFAEFAAGRDASGIFGWIGDSCRHSKFGRYFNRSLLLSALVLLPLLFRRLRLLRQEVRGLPPAGRRVSTAVGLVQCLLGVLIAGGLLWGFGLVMEGIGAFSVNPAALKPGRLLGRALVPAVVVSVVEEWLFRGLLLGLWLRVSRPLPAIIGTSLVFAFLHFITPPPGVEFPDPSAPLAGFQLLGAILLRFSEPGFFLAEFLSLFVIGLVLAGARLRTGRLWFPIGLHCGWVLAFKAYNLTHSRVLDTGMAPWWIGENLSAGLLPLAVLGITAAASFLALRATERFSRDPDHPADRVPG